jgi:hypothetical protein
MPADLELFSTEDLMAELYARYDCVVFAGLRDLNQQEQDSDFGFAGGATTAKGLCGDLLDYIKAQQTIPQPPREREAWEDAEDA